jgi:hypothetical protein
VLRALRKFTGVSPEAQKLSGELARLKTVEVRNRATVRVRFEPTLGRMAWGLKRREALGLARRGLATPDLTSAELRHLLALLRRFPCDETDALARALAARQDEIVTRENAPAVNLFAAHVHRCRADIEARHAMNRGEPTPLAVALARIRSRAFSAAH